MPSSSVEPTRVDIYLYLLLELDHRLGIPLGGIRSTDIGWQALLLVTIDVGLHVRSHVDMCL